MADVDQNGVHLYGEEILISVCKETTAEWKQASVVYASEGLFELLKSKA